MKTSEIFVYELLCPYHLDAIPLPTPIPTKNIVSLYQFLILAKFDSWLILLISLSLWCSSTPAVGQENHWIAAEKLAEIPDPVGLAGPFCGLVNDSLLVAGGANFPNGMPWEGGTKIWHDDVYRLDRPDGSWKHVGHLPRPLGYGVAFTLTEGLLLIGGSDATQHYADVYLLAFVSDQLQFQPLPSLPVQLANMAGMLIDDKVYVVGGSFEPGEQAASNRVFSLGVEKLLQNQPGTAWSEEPPLPGSGRLLPGIAAMGSDLFVFGGAEIVVDADRRRRSYLQNGFKLSLKQVLKQPTKNQPTKNQPDGDQVGRSIWQPIADLPVPLVATPFPSPAIGPNHFLVCGGDDGSRVGFEPIDQHSGFNGTCWGYHVITNTWTELGRLQNPTVTTQIVPWQDRFVIPSGELRPGVRAASVTSFRLVSPTPTFGIINYVTLVVYLLIVFGIGLLAAGKIVNTNQFFRADQSIPWWAAGLSIFATMLSSITFMSIPAQGFSVGWNLFVGSIYVILTPLVVYVYVPYFRKLDITSAYEFLEIRFNLAVRLFASLQFILFQLGRIAVVLFLPSLALATVAGVNIYVSIVLVGVLCVAYTMFGGMKAVIWTDAVQAVILLGGAFIALIAIIYRVPGGVGQIISVADEGQKFFHSLSWSWDTTIATGWAIMMGSIFSNLFSYTASQDVVQRYLTTSDQKTAGRAIWINAIMAPVAQALFFAIGTGLFAFYYYHPHKLHPTIANDGIFPFFVVQELPVGLAGLIVAAVFAASQSTVSSSLNSLATAVVTDFYRRFQPQASDQRALRLARFITLIAGLIGIGLAILLASLGEIRSLWEIFIAVLGLFGGSVSGLFFLGMFTTRTHGTGAMVGALASVAVVMWMFFSGGLFWWYSVAGVFVCVFVGYTVSLVGPKPLPRKTFADFFN